MNKLRSYTPCRFGLAVVWAILLTSISHIRPDLSQRFLLIFGGFAMAWLLGTIARWVYRPPGKWMDAAQVKHQVRRW